MRHVIDFLSHLHAPARGVHYSAFLLLAFAGAHPVNASTHD